MVEDGLDIVSGSGSSSGSALDVPVQSSQDAVLIAVDAPVGAGFGYGTPASWGRRRTARRCGENIVFGKFNRSRGGGGLGL